MKRNFIFSFIALFFLIVACAQQTAPKDPIWNKDGCSRCRMIITEKDFAVQRILKNGFVYYYDDLNCALAHGKMIESDGSELYVRPRGLETWIKASEAKFTKGFQTPMGSGFGATADGSLTFTDVQKELGVQ